MIKIENLQVDLGGFHLKDISLDVSDNEYFVLLGPTAAGKTVLLESIAGLIPVKRGRIYTGGKDITDISPEKRGVSLVYQDHVLFPHLSVKDNITYGLRLKRHTASQIQESLEWLDGLLGFKHLLGRRPATLSGGEKQKVALARALSIKPDILLLDEPLSALDPETREKVQGELKTVHRALKSTFMHVTHDFEEAMSLGTRIAVIGEGKIQQTGTPEEIFRRPQSRFVAGFTLMKNIYQGEMFAAGGQYFFKTGETIMELNHNPQSPKDCFAGIRPEDVELYREPTTSMATNRFEGQVISIQDRGTTLIVLLKSRIELQCLLTRRQFSEMNLKTGDWVTAYLNPAAIHVFK